MAPKQPAIPLDELKTRIQSLKERAEALTAKKDALLRESATTEQRHTQAVEELAGLGYPQAKGLDIQGLTALGSEIAENLTKAIGDLEKAVTSAEAIMAEE